MADADPDVRAGVLTSERAPTDRPAVKTGPDPKPGRRRHASPDDSDDADAAAAGSPDETVDDDAPRGRHGRRAAGGLSAAELIARMS
ncbi:MAG: hypothetical protein JWM76_3119 [Pseudonocardiales bacterium]|nr:hypothetical protein [Pseudonocardiales bacterium]